MSDDEFAEFEISEDEFDSIMARGEPAELVPAKRGEPGDLYWTPTHGLHRLPRSETCGWSHTRPTEIPTKEG